MGGVSAGRCEAGTEGTALFTGEVSLAHGGGFASVRSPVPEPGIDASAGIRLRVRGDGKAYKLTAKMDAALDGVQYQARFSPPADQWTAIVLPWEAFAPTFRGRPLPGEPPLDPRRVRQIGLMISDRQAGPFRLEIAAIEVVAEE
jgi:hypothetical protein